MSFWNAKVSSQVQQWLLESEHPGVRYLALRDLKDCLQADPGTQKAYQESHRVGKIARILSHMHPDGYWVKPGPGYGCKYRSSVWSLIALAQLGASAEEDQRLFRACSYHLDASLTTHGMFTMSGTPSSTIDCLQGNMCAAMLDLGFGDQRLDRAFEWMARSVTGEGVAPVGERGAEIRYYSGKIGPDFQCGYNNKLPCAWGAVKVMLAFGKLPKEKRTPLIDRAVERGVDFLLSVNPATAAYPCGYNEKPSRNWWKFGFPVFYITDILQLVESLVSLGYGRNRRLASAVQLIQKKADARGRWALDYVYSSPWTDFGEKNQPNPWVTLRALKVLKWLDREIT